MSNGMEDKDQAVPSRETWLSTTEGTIRELRMRVGDYATRLDNLNNRLMGPQPSQLDKPDPEADAKPHSAMDSMNREATALQEQVERLGSELSRLEQAGLC